MVKNEGNARPVEKNLLDTLQIALAERNPEAQAIWVVEVSRFISQRSKRPQRAGGVSLFPVTPRGIPL